MAPHEDVPGNPLHLVLYLAALALLVATFRPKGTGRYAVLVMGGFLIFCALLRWQPWHSRLQLPLFLLFTPVAGSVISNLRHKRVERALVWLFAVAALP